MCEEREENDEAPAERSAVREHFFFLFAFAGNTLFR